MVMDSINDCSTGLYKGKSNLWYPVLEGKCRVVKSLTYESPTKFGFIISVYT